MSAAPAISVDDAIAQYGEEAVRRSARHALWRAGDLSYLLHAGQLACLERMGATETRRFLLNIGRRWGKSRLMCVVAVWLAVLRILHRSGVDIEASRAPGWLVRAALRTKRPTRVVYAAPTAGMVAEFIEPHMRLLCDHAPPELCPALNGMTGTWSWPDGDKIVVRGCEDSKKADRLRGSEADMGIVDEGGFIPILDYVVRSVVGPQLWETRGRMLLPSTPPESPDHPFVGLVAEAEAAGAYFHATTADAPHITPQMLASAIEDAGGPDTIAWKREGLAQILVDPQQTVLPEFSEHADVIVQEHERPEHFQPHVIGDAGFTDLDVLAFGYYDFKADIDVIEDEVVLQHARSDLLDAKVAAKERELWDGMKVHRRRIDAMPKVRADMSREEWQAEDPEDGVRHWNPVSRDGGERMGRMRASANAARVRVQRGRVRVHPRCATIIAHAKYARWAPNRRDFVRPDDGSHHYDGCAAFLYFLRDLDRASNPYPKLPPGVTRDTHHIPQHLLRDNAQVQLARIFGKARAR